MRTLYVTSAPIFPCNTGYKQSVVGRIYEKALQGSDITVVELSNESVHAITCSRPSELRNISIISRRNHRGLSPLQELSNFLSLRPRYVSIFSTKQFRDSVRSAIEETQPDFIYAESLWTLAAIPTQYHQAVTLVVHDVATHFFSQMLRGEPNSARKFLLYADRLRCPRYERAEMKRFEGNLMFLTEEDRQFYVENFGLDPDRTSIASNRLLANAVVRDLDKISPFLLFAGSVDFSQNYLALNWFLRHVWPSVRSAIAVDVRLVVTGRASARHRLHFARFSDVDIVGEVSVAELDELYSRCICAISPIISGTGIKIKNLEAVQKNVPVVTTRLASRGIYSKLCYAANDDAPESFVSALLHCWREQWITMESRSSSEGFSESENSLSNLT